MSKEAMKYLNPGAIVPVDIQTTALLVNALREALAEQPAQQEPVVWVCYGAPGKRDIDFEEADINGLPIGTQLYASAPAQRTWVGLTKGEIDCWELPDKPTVAEFAWFVEAKLKEKNT